MSTDVEMIHTGKRLGYFVVDGEGRKVGVLLSLEEYVEIMAELEELESIRAYDAAKSSGEKPRPWGRSSAPDV